MSDIDTDLETPDELTALKARADLLGIKYHPSISLEKLRDKVNAAVSGEEEAATEDAVATTPAAETEDEMRVRLKREANELVRINVTCMNPAKAEWDGEIFTAGNSLVGSFTKYVPFNTTEGYHVPRIIYNQLVQRECQIFVTVRHPNGGQGKQGKLIKEFAIQELPMLTLDELHDLAQRQAMANGTST